MIRTTLPRQVFVTFVDRLTIELSVEFPLETLKSKEIEKHYNTIQQNIRALIYTFKSLTNTFISKNTLFCICSKFPTKIMNR